MRDLMVHDTDHSRYHLEAQKIFLSIFNRAPSAVVVDRFIEISRRIEIDYSMDEINYWYPEKQADWNHGAPE